MLTTRRDVLKLGVAATAATAFASGAGTGASAQGKSLTSHMGLQLYTVGKELSADPPATLAQVAAIGYRVVESAGFGGLSAKDFRKALDAAGLRCPSSHLFLGPGQNVEQFFEDARTLGSEYVVSSFLIDPKASIKSSADYFHYAFGLTQDDFKKMADGISEMAQQAAKAGLKFAYHNHNVEFRRWSDGSTPFDILMSRTDAALVSVELDCGWAHLGGASPLQLFKQYQGRFRMLHIKDFESSKHARAASEQDYQVQGVELGRGSMNYRSILEAAPAAGVEQAYVEQEPPFTTLTAMAAAKADYDYLRDLRRSRR